MLIGGLIAALTVISKPQLYVGSASFLPQGNDANRSTLASLAGQFGVSLPAGNQALSPEFYSNLLKSRVLLEPIARDTFVVPELRGERISFLDLFGVRGDSPQGREEAGVRMLMAIVTPTISKTTGVVEVSVATRWRSVSLAITTAVVDGINEYNQRTRRGQAEVERKFVEGRLALAGAELRQAEDRMERFLSTNRMVSNSPELNLEHDRIRREVDLRQQVFTSLTQAYEDARIREVRDTPVISLFEPPAVPTLAESRGRLKRALLGVALGGLVGVMVAFTSAMMAERRRIGDPDADEFVGMLCAMKHELSLGLRWIPGRSRR
jgi:uncharacterized protein involved in exopolysaccharide biosynthesis